LRDLPVVRGLVRAYEERLTPRGRWLLGLLLVLGPAGLDTRRTGIFILFSAAAGLFAAASLFAFLRRPRVRLTGGFPPRATALTPVSVRVGIEAEPGRPMPDLFLTVPGSGPASKRIAVSPRDTLLAGGPGRTAGAVLTLQPGRRGRYVLKGPRAGVPDPLGLMATKGPALPDSVLLVYPRYFALDRFDIPLGRRYQPGGIPLSSNTGDSVEFVGAREYRPGDPVRNIHWRSWARRGAPVVREFQEEYFCRIAVILDTFLPRKPRPRDLEAFEAAITVTASIADFFSRSEYIVDILAAGPDLYEVSSGRSLAYLENILDVLACLEPCHEPPFATVGPPLFEKLSQITTVVAVLQDWDAPREAFLRRVRAMGTALRVMIVRDGPTAKPWAGAAEELGEIEQMTPADVERALAK
jgi:uncharacterized protein (DUF58 family)